MEPFGAGSNDPVIIALTYILIVAHDRSLTRRNIKSIPWDPAVIFEDASALWDADAIRAVLIGRALVTESNGVSTNTCTILREKMLLTRAFCNDTSRGLPRAPQGDAAKSWDTTRNGWRDPRRTIAQGGSCTKALACSRAASISVALDKADARHGVIVGVEAVLIADASVVGYADAIAAVRIIAATQGRGALISIAASHKTQLHLWCYSWGATTTVVITVLEEFLLAHYR